MAEEKKTEAVKEEKPTKVEKTEEKIDTSYPDVQAGTLVRVHQEITDITPKGEEKKRIQIFEGMVIQRKHGKGVTATITVRKESSKIGVEKIFPLHLPTIKKIEVVKTFRTRRSKIGFIRTKHKKLKEVK